MIKLLTRMFLMISSFRNFFVLISTAQIFFYKISFVSKLFVQEFPLNLLWISFETFGLLVQTVPASERIEKFPVVKVLTMVTQFHHRELPTHARTMIMKACSLHLMCGYGQSGLGNFRFWPSVETFSFPFLRKNLENLAWQYFSTEIPRSFQLKNILAGKLRNG